MQKRQSTVKLQPPTLLYHTKETEVHSMQPMFHFNENIHKLSNTSGCGGTQLSSTHETQAGKPELHAETVSQKNVTNKNENK